MSSSGAVSLTSALSASALGDSAQLRYDRIRRRVPGVPLASHPHPACGNFNSRCEPLGLNHSSRGSTSSTELQREDQPSSIACGSNPATWDQTSIIELPATTLKYYL
ncbi:hypothetical protein P885DRAFT_77104 [Corynascus similis CBS 632.67]